MTEPTRLPVRGHGGRREGSGRPRNASPRIIRSMRNEPISMRAKYAVLPLDHLLSILNSKDATKAERFEAAKVAAPYMHQRLSAVVLTNDSEPRQTTLDLTRFTDDEVATFEVLLAKAQAQPPTLPTPAFDPEADEEYLCPSWKPGDPIS